MRWRRLRSWAAPGVALAASAAALLVVIARNDAEHAAPYVGVKGAPSVQVLVKREGQSSVWDGRMPLAPGDVLALRVGCESFRHVAIATPSPSSKVGWVQLAEAPCDTDALTLPFTLIVDDHGAEERLAVVFSARPLDGRALSGAADQTTRTATVWSVPLVLQKSASQPGR